MAADYDAKVMFDKMLADLGSRWMSGVGNVFGLLVVLGLPLPLLAFAGYNLSTAQANFDPHRVGIGSLVAGPPQQPLWVMVRGQVVLESRVQNAGVDYVLLLDADERAAIFVRLAPNSALYFPKPPESVIVKGMTSSLPTGSRRPEPKGLPEGVAVANAVVLENETPPSVWFNGLLVLLGIAFWLAPFFLPRRKAAPR